MQWRSGEKVSLGCFRAGQLVTVRLQLVSGGPEMPGNGLPPHLVFEPATTTDLRRHPDRLWSSNGAPDPSYRLDLVPLRLPYSGNLFLDGGNRTTTYEVHHYATSPVEVPATAHGPHCITLRQVGGAGVAIPFGTAGLWVPIDGQLRFVAAGETIDLDVTAGQRISVSNWAGCGGTVGARTPAVAQEIMCEVWL